MPDSRQGSRDAGEGSRQYITVYDNGDKGGFAGSKPVSQTENLRCAFDKTQGRGAQEVG